MQKQMLPLLSKLQKKNYAFLLWKTVLAINFSHAEQCFTFLQRYLGLPKERKKSRDENTYSTRGANANDGYVRTLGMIQQFDQLVQHD